jgi:hypothetical protein
VTYRQADSERQADNQTDRQADSQGERIQTGRQADRRRLTYCDILVTYCDRQYITVYTYR